MEFFPEIVLTDREAELIAHGMMAVARADGKVHDREVAMVQSFYGEIVEGSGASLQAIVNEPDIEPQTLAAGLSRQPVAMLFVKTSILCAYADGAYHPKEKAKIEAYATALGIGAEIVADLEQGVKEYLMGQLTGIQNREAALEVAKKLGV